MTDNFSERATLIAPELAVPTDDRDEDYFNYIAYIHEAETAVACANVCLDRMGFGSAHRATKKAGWFKYRMMQTVEEVKNWPRWLRVATGLDKP